MSSWLHELGARGGPLGEVAARFCAWRGEGASIPRGADAIRWLADAIDRWLDEDEADDERFVEGAGAFLGAVLVDRLGAAHVARAGVHRVDLGDDGFFDPFGAIGAALEADDPDAELAARVRAAEAEARGEGPVAFVVGAFRRALAEARPDLRVESRFGLELSLSEGLELDLHRVAELAGAAGHAREALVRGAVARLVSLLPGGEGADVLVPWRDAEPRLLPRLVGPRFLAQLAERADALWLVPFGHDVQVALQLRFEGRARYVRRDEEARWAAEGAEPFAAALVALALRAGEARWAALEGGALRIARTGDGLDAARLLLPDVRDGLRDTFGGSVRIGVPHRDTLIAGADPALVAHHVHDAFSRAPHPISEALFRIE
ncbi:MAG: hypothetical protein KF901_32310 [Myxococcales bacterium]|nr:hypothetical protein [Myxococcales bacterium]